MQDLRQSDGWGEYLEFLGWKCVRTSNGALVFLRKSLVGTVTKIQRPKALSHKDLEEIEEICKKHNALFIKIEPQLDQNLEFLEKEKYTVSAFPLLSPSTIYIDLTRTEDELWGDISHNGKYSIKRAQREKTKVEFYKNPDKAILKIFYEVAKQVARRKKFYIHSFDELVKKTEVFKDRAHLVLAYNNVGVLTGGNFCLEFAENVWFTNGATSNEGRKTLAGYELLWKSFLYFKKRGISTLDLEGKDDDRFPNFTKNWGGFSRFKEDFGGKEVSFPPPYIKILNPALKILVKLYPSNPL